MDKNLVNKLIKILHSYSRYKDISNIEITKITPIYSGLFIEFTDSELNYTRVINYNRINKTNIELIEHFNI